MGEIRPGMRHHMPALGEYRSVRNPAHLVVVTRVDDVSSTVYYTERVSDERREMHGADFAREFVAVGDQST